MQSVHVGRFHCLRFYFSCFSAAFPFPSNDLSRRSVSPGVFVLYGLPAPEFPRARTRRERTGKAISRKWRAQYTGRRVVQFRISNWYLPARRKVRRYGATKVRFVVENVTCMFRVSSSLQHSINNTTSESSH